VSKFNRMGFQKGYRPEDLAIIRVGICFKHDPNATEPCQFMYVVGDPSAPEETWAQGLSMYHNPRALVPVPEELFPGIAHHRLDEQKRMQSVVPEFHPFSSITLSFNGVPDSTVVPPLSPAFSQMMKGRPPVGGGDVGGSVEMPAGVRRISRLEYQSHNLARGPSMAPVTEKSWFSNEKGLIGTVFLDHSDKDWNFAVLGPDSEGAYRWVTGGGGMDTEEEAEKALMAEMSSR
jgi:hypothetical protein